MLQQSSRSVQAITRDRKHIPQCLSQTFISLGYPLTSIFIFPHHHQHHHRYQVSCKLLQVNMLFHTAECAKSFADTFLYLDEMLSNMSSSFLFSINLSTCFNMFQFFYLLDVAKQCQLSFSNVISCLCALSSFETFWFTHVGGPNIMADM